MDENKISVNIGGNSFEATGPEASEQFKIFVSLLKEGKNFSKDQKELIKDEQSNINRNDFGRNDYLKIFEISENSDYVRLKYPPSIDDVNEKIEVAILMILIGSKILLNMAELGVTKISKSLQESGFGKNARLTYWTDSLSDQHFILASGKKSGKKYAPTATGVTKASEFINGLIKSLS